MAAAVVEPDRFRPLFALWAGRVRSRLVARWALTGLATGLAASAVAAALAWGTGHAAMRPWCALGGGFGALVGLALGRRRRWSDVDVALWLDDRLAASEAITTAVGLEARGEDQPGAAGERRHDAVDAGGARAVVVGSAARALAEGDPRRARPRVLRPVHALAPIAAAALVLLCRLPVATRPTVNPPPGQALVRITQVDGLTRIAQLEHADARDALQRDRLTQIARRAEALSADLQRGLEKRDALDRIERLRDEIAAERLTLGDGAERAGLEAAISKLEATDATRRAARALGDHDLERMDREMERIANLREKRDRESAKRALRDAAAAARAAGAPGVAGALGEEGDALRSREKRAEALRDLEHALEGSGEADGETGSHTEALDRRGSDEAARKLADSLGRALEKLSPEERRRVAEKLRKQAQSGAAQSNPDDLKELAGELSTPQGREKLEDRLKELAGEEDEAAESRRQRALDDADDGAGAAEGDIGGHKPSELGPRGGPDERRPRGEPGEGAPSAGNGDGVAQGDGEGDGLPSIPLPGGAAPASRSAGAPGGSGEERGAAGSHAGSTGPVAAGTLKSRAHAPLNRAAAMAGATTGWTPGNSGATANVQGSGALGSVGPAEIDGVDRGEIPEEYREQVRQYFQP